MIELALAWFSLNVVAAVATWLIGSDEPTEWTADDWAVLSGERSL